MKKQIRLDNTRQQGKSGIYNIHHNLKERIKRAKELLIDSLY